MTVYMVTHDDRIKAIRDAAEAVEGAGNSYRVERLKETIATAQAELAEVEAEARGARVEAETELLKEAGWTLSVYDAEKGPPGDDAVYVHEAFGEATRAQAVKTSLGLARLLSIPYDSKYPQAAKEKAVTS